MAWNYDITAAPKDRPILGLCVHEADPYHDEATGRLTDYGCSAEGLGRVQDGPHVLVWGGGDSEYDEWSQKNIVWPDWWFRFGSEFEEAANPIAWMPVPDEGSHLPAYEIVQSIDCKHADRPRHTADPYGNNEQLLRT